MIDCPNCGAPLAENAVICNGCRWTPAAAKVKPGADVNSAGYERQCGHYYPEGERCSHRASIFRGAARTGFCTKHDVAREEVGIPCPPHIREKIAKTLGLWNVTPERRRRDPDADEERAAIQDEAS